MRCICIEKRGMKINLFGIVIGIKRVLNIVVILLILFVVVCSFSFMCKVIYLFVYCELCFLNENILVLESFFFLYELFSF